MPFGYFFGFPTVTGPASTWNLHQPTQAQVAIEQKDSDAPESTCCRVEVVDIDKTTFSPYPDVRSAEQTLLLFVFDFRLKKVCA